MTAREVRQLLDKVCIQFGFCLSAAAITQLEEKAPSDPVTFTDSIFLLEGLDPITADRHVYRLVKGAVMEAFRASEERPEHQD